MTQVIVALPYQVSSGARGAETSCERSHDLFETFCYGTGSLLLTVSQFSAPYPRKDMCLYVQAPGNFVSDACGLADQVKPRGVHPVVRQVVSDPGNGQ
jgi:hypothetical protein